MKSLTSYLLKLLLLAALAATSYFLLFKYAFPPQYFYKNYWIVVMVFALISFLYHQGLVKSNARGDREMVRYFMAATGLKMFALILIVVVFFVADKEHVIAFTIALIVMYVLFTTFEVMESQGLIYKK